MRARGRDATREIQQREGKERTRGTHRYDTGRHAARRPVKRLEDVIYVEGDVGVECEPLAFWQLHDCTMVG